jgi:hypothetical protein
MAIIGVSLAWMGVLLMVAFMLVLAVGVIMGAT